MERLVAPGIAILLILLLTTSGIPEITPEQPQFFINISYEEEFSPDFSDVLLAVRIGDTITPIEANFTEYKKGKWALFQLQRYYDEEDIITYLDLSQYNPVQTEGKIEYSFEKQGTEGTIVIQNSPITEVKIHNITKDSQLEFQMLDKNFSNAPEEDPLQAFSINPKNIDSAEVTVIAKGYFLFKCKDWDYDAQECTGEWKYLFPTLPGHEYTINLSATDPGYMEGSNFIAFDVDDNTVTTNLSSSDDVYAAKNNTQVYWVNGTWNTGGPLDEIYFANFTCELKSNETIPATFLMQWWNTSSHQWETFFNYSDWLPNFDVSASMSALSVVNASDFAHTFRCYVNTSQSVDISIDQIGFIYDAKEINLCGGITGSDKEYYLGTDLSGFTSEGSCLNISYAKNITIDCNGSSIIGDLTAITAGIFMDSSDQIRLKNCIVKNYTLGIYLDSMENSSIFNTSSSSNSHNFVQNECFNVSMHNLSSSNTSGTSNIFSSVHVASHVYLLDTYNSSVENSIFYLSGDEGIVIEGGGNNTIENISISSTSGHAFYLEGAVDYLIKNVTIDTAGYGFVFRWGNNVELEDITIFNTTSYGFNSSSFISMEIRNMFQYNQTKYILLTDSSTNNIFTNLTLGYNETIGLLNYPSLSLTDSGDDPDITSSNLLLGWNFTSLDTSSAGIPSAMNAPANLTLWTPTCTNTLYLEKSGFPVSREAILSNSLSFTPAYSSCVGEETTFQVEDFSGYAASEAGICRQISGDTLLTGNVVGNLTTGACLSIISNNTVLDCNGFSIQGTESGITIGIYADNLHNITVRNCIIENYTLGIYFDSMENSSIFNTSSSSNTHNFVQNNCFNVSMYNLSSSNTSGTSNIFSADHIATHVYLLSTYNSSVWNGTFYLSGDEGIVIEEGGNNTIENISIFNTTDTGFYFDYTDNNTIYNVSINYTKNGVFFDNSNGNTAPNFIVYNFSGTALVLDPSVDNDLGITAVGGSGEACVYDACVYIDGSSTPPSGISLGGCGCTYGIRSEVFLGGDSYSATGGTGDGIWAKNGISASSIDASGNGAHGILVWTGDITALSIDASGNGGYGINVGTGDITATSIDVSGNGGTGILVGTGDVSATSITANSNGGRGIMTSAGSLQANSIEASGNGLSGLSISFGNIVADSITTNGNVGAGTSTSGSLQAGSIEASGNGDSGLYAGLDITITGSVTASGNGLYGMEAYGTTHSLSGVTANGNFADGIKMRGSSISLSGVVTANSNRQSGLQLIGPSGGCGDADVSFAGPVSANGNGISGSSYAGISVDGNATFGNTVSANDNVGGHGISIYDTATFNGHVGASRNLLNGIHAYYAVFNSGVTVEDNSQQGISLSSFTLGDGGGEFYGTTIASGNARNGIYTDGSLLVGAGSSITANGNNLDVGDFCRPIWSPCAGIVAYKITSLGSIITNQNKGFGIWLNGPIPSSFSNAVTTNLNDRGGLLVGYQGSGAGPVTFEAGSSLTSQNNKESGINATSSYIYLNGPSDISNNQLYGVYLDGSNISADSSQIQSNALDGIYLLANPHASLNLLNTEIDHNQHGIYVVGYPTPLELSADLSSIDIHDNSLTGIYFENLNNSQLDISGEIYSNSLDGLYLLNVENSIGDFGAGALQVYSNRHGVFFDNSNSNKFVNTLAPYLNSDSGLYMLNSEDNSFEGQLITTGNTNYGLYFENADSNNFTDANITGSGSIYAVYLKNSNSNRFKEFLFQGDTNTAGIMLNNSDNNLFNGTMNSSDNIQIGVYLEFSDYNVFSGDINVSGNGISGLYLLISDYNNFTGANISSSGSDYAVYLEQADYNRFTEFELEADINTEAGIYLDTSTYNLFNGTINSSNGNIGILLNSSNNNVFDGGELDASDNSLAGLYLDSSGNNNFSGEVSFSDNTYANLYFDNSHYNLFDDAEIESNGATYGIYMESSSSNRFLDGSIDTKSNSQSGIYMDTSHSNVFNLPVISHLNTVTGIYFDTSSSNLFSGGINLSGNGEEALYFQSSNSNNFSEANITSIGATYGVYMNSSSSNKFENLKLSASQNVFALFLNYSGSNKFLGDITSEENLYASIYLESCWNNNFTGIQTLTGSSILGELWFISSGGNNFSGLNITGNNTQHTVYLSVSPDNVLLGNISTRDHDVTGVMIEDSNNCVLAGNITSNNSYSGVILYNSDNAFLSGLDLNNNTYGLLLNESSEGEIQNSYARENLLFDLYVELGVISDCDHIITNMVGSGNRPIIYYNDSSVFAGGEVSELLLCDADDAEIYNANVSGSDILNNNGILLINTDDAVVAYTNSSDNYAGLVVIGSNDNIFGGMELHRNNYSVLLAGSDENILINLTISNTTTDIDPPEGIYPGIYLDDSNWNELINISVYNTSHGIVFDGTSEENTINTSEIYENEYGILFNANEDNYLLGSDIHSNDLGIMVNSVDGFFITYLTDVHDNNQAGIVFAGEDAGGGIYLSNIVDNGIANVYFMATDAHSEMIYCNISGAPYGIVLNHTTNWIVVNYTSINATEHSIWLQDNTSLFALINSTVYSGSTEPIIYFAEGSLEGPTLMPHTNIFYDSTVYSPQGDIIFFENTSTDVNYFANFAVCYNESTGCVMWEDAQVNYTNLSLNKNIYLDPGFVSLNDSDGNATQFNNSAYITLDSPMAPCDAGNIEVKKKDGYPSTRLDIITNGINYASASISCPSTETVRFSVNAFSGYAVDVGVPPVPPAPPGGGADNLILTVTPTTAKFGTDVLMQITGAASCINNAEITVRDPDWISQTFSTTNGKLIYAPPKLGDYRATGKAPGCKTDSENFEVVEGFLDLIVYPASIEKGQSIQLYVLDENKDYLSNATITIVWPSGAGFSNAVLTSTDINLTFTPPDLGTYTATATKQNYEPDDENFIVVQPTAGPGEGGEEEKEPPEMERPGLKVEPDRKEAEVEEVLILTVISMEDGSLLSGAKVYATCAEEERFLGYTNDIGQINFTPWIEGTCILRAEKAGFVPDEDEVNIIKKAVEIPREEPEETLEQKATAIITQWGWLLLLLLLLAVLIYIYKTKQKKGKKGKKRRTKKLKSKKK
ncbi:right-handed parallel beta-helix repeat-containing protein [Candidatus Micrarchaeota archaeon]|nr:right-handed parallel beta-helix repeat-containing protein [Candidatus Micrarchaeota archaeon]